MSLGINVTIPEGIVLAADSRQTYRNQKGMARVGSDSASKVFRIGSRMGLVIAGLAFLPQQGVMKNVSGFIDDFRQTIPVDKLSVGEVAKELAQYFDARVPYRDQLKAIPAGITSGHGPPGYGHRGPQGRTDPRRVPLQEQAGSGPGSGCRA